LHYFTLQHNADASVPGAASRTCRRFKVPEHDAFSELKEPATQRCEEIPTSLRQHEFPSCSLKIDHFF